MEQQYYIKLDEKTTPTKSNGKITPNQKEIMKNLKL